jgi:hypothetical protein
MGVAEVARLLARTLASPATRQIIMDRALVRVARTCSVRGAGNHGFKRRNSRYTYAKCAPGAWERHSRLSLRETTSVRGANGDYLPKLFFPSLSPFPCTCREPEAGLLGAV